MRVRVGDGETMTTGDRRPATGRAITKTLQAQLRAYRGKWVAMTRNQLLASGNTVGGVLRAARRKGVEHPIVYKVPTEERTAYFG